MSSIGTPSSFQWVDAGVPEDVHAQASAPGPNAGAFDAPLQNPVDLVVADPGGWPFRARPASTERRKERGRYGGPPRAPKGLEIKRHRHFRAFEHGERNRLRLPLRAADVDFPAHLVVVAPLEKARLSPTERDVTPDGDRPCFARGSAVRGRAPNSRGWTTALGHSRQSLGQSESLVPCASRRARDGRPPAASCTQTCSRRPSCSDLTRGREKEVSRQGGDAGHYGQWLAQPSDRRPQVSDQYSASWRAQAGAKGPRRCG